jgi:hypothetical protein
MQGEQHVDISGFIGSLGFGDEPGIMFRICTTMQEALTKPRKW